MRRRKGREGQSVIGVGGQAEEEEGTKVRWTEGGRGSRWVWKCIHLSWCRDRNRATGSEVKKNTPQTRAIPTFLHLSQYEEFEIVLMAFSLQISPLTAGFVSKQIH